MKKILSVLLSFVMLLSCFSLGSLTALANKKSEAVAIKTGSSVSVSLNSTEKEYWISFKPSKTAVYEFEFDTVPDGGEVDVTIYDSKGEFVGGNMFGAFSENLTVIAMEKLKKGSTYYVVINADGYDYSGKLKVVEHTKHKYETLEMPAFYDAEDPEFCFDGGKVLICDCLDYKEEATYYCPKTLKLAKSSYVYDGKKKTPKVTVKDRKGNVIAKSNYKVTYKNNTKPGKATVTVTFNDKKYSGVMTKTFTIKPKKQTLSSVKSSKSKQITVKWRKDANVSGYQVQYSTSSKFKSAKTVNVSKNSTTSKNISKLKGGKKYYVRVRAYKTIDGKKVYGAWSSAKSTTVKK